MNEYDEYILIGRKGDEVVALFEPGDLYQNAELLADLARKHPPGFDGLSAAARIAEVLLELEQRSLTYDRDKPEQGS